MLPLLLTLLTVAPARHGERLGSRGISADMPHGIGGLIDAPVEPTSARERAALARAWGRLQSTDQPFRALLDRPRSADPQDTLAIRGLLDAVHDLEEALVHVVNLGQARPGVAALTRLGQVYEAAGAWLSAIPRSRPRPGADDLYLLRQCESEAEPIWQARARAAYVTAVTKGWDLGLHGEPALTFAIGRLRVLDPDAYPPLPEDLPEPWAAPRPSFEGEP